MNFRDFKEILVQALKVAVYGGRGEPYQLGDHLLRYQPGTRPVRLKYINSGNDNVRYDAMQVQLFSESVKKGDFALNSYATVKSNGLSEAQGSHTPIIAYVVPFLHKAASAPQG